MCDTTKTLPVMVPADLSGTGTPRIKLAEIDSCIALIVDALNKGGVLTRSSCCGHGKRDGEIQLQDGRVLIITTNTDKPFTMMGKNGETVTLLPQVQPNYTD